MAYTFGTARIQQWNGSEWNTDSWEMGWYGTNYLRCRFIIIGDQDEPGSTYPPGEIRVQVDYGAGWTDYSTGKNITPWRIIDGAEYAGEWYPNPGPLGEFVGLPLYGHGAAGTFGVRAKVTWAGETKYSDSISYDLIDDTSLFMEVISPPGGGAEQGGPTGSWGEQSAPADGFAEQSSPSDVFSDSEQGSPAVPIGSWGEQSAPADGFSEQSAPADGFSEQSAPLDGFTEQSSPSDGFTEQSAPSDGFSEKDESSVSWTEQST